jgi:hypothetical protein
MWVVHTCNPSTREAETRVQECPALYGELHTSLGYIARSSPLKQKQKQTKNPKQQTKE